MAEFHVIEELQTFLIAQAIGQLPPPSSPPPAAGSPPSIWLQPRDGAPLPRGGESMTITLVDSSVNVPHSLEAWIEETFVDVIVRSRSAPAAKLTHRRIRELLHPTAAHGGRKQWTMGALTIEYSRIWRGEQPLPPPATGQAVTYDRVASYQFGARRKALAGLPLP